MEKKYTEGPWTVHFFDDFDRFEIHPANDHDGTVIIADLGHDTEGTPKEKEANAQAISAVPDLVEALQQCQKVLFDYAFSDETPEMCCFEEAEVTAIAALRKALG